MSNESGDRSEIKAGGKNMQAAGNHRSSGSRSGSQSARGTASDKTAQRKGGQHSRGRQSGNR